MTVQEIERIYREGLKKIQAPPSPDLRRVVFGKEDCNDDLTFVIAQCFGYRYGNYDRGNAGNVHYSADTDDVLYYLFCGATYDTTSYNLKKCNKLCMTRKFDLWRGIWQKMQLDLLSIINPLWPERKKKESEEIVAKYSSRDNPPVTIEIMDDFPCPVINPNISPGSCPLDDESAPCSLQFLQKCSTLFWTKKFDYRWLIQMKIELDLLSIINPPYAQRKRTEYEEYMAKSPSLKKFPRAFEFMDNYPCPVASPNIPPGICPLDDEGGPCIFLNPIQ